MEIVKIGNDNVINIKDIPSKKTEDFISVPSDIFSKKISGGIFYDKSIKFIRDEMQMPFIPDMSGNNKGGNNGGNNGGGDDGMSDLERRVQNLESETQKIREQLTEIKFQNSAIVSKLDNSITKNDLLSFQTTINSAINNIPSISEIKNTVREIIKEDNISSTNDIKLIISDEMKKVPSTNDIKSILNETISEKKLTTETKVENLLMKQRNSTIKWVIGTGIAIIAATAGILKLFLP